MNTDHILAEFSVIRVMGKCQLSIQKGENAEVIINNKISGIDIEFEVQDNELLIYAIPDYDDGPESPISKITITYIKIKSIILTGGIDLYTKNVITGQSFALSLNGTGNVIISVEVVNLDLTLVKAGAIRVIGKATSSFIVLLGTGIYEGQGLDSGYVSVEVSDQGTASVSAEYDLTGTITNRGTLLYSGTPCLRGLSIEGNSKMMPLNGRLHNLL